MGEYCRHVGSEVVGWQILSREDFRENRRAS